jgi:type VI secretion system protein ImpI/type VI secretion system protein
MPLTLTMLRCPTAVRPERRSVRGGELSVGRGPGVDWVLPDPEQTISRRHFTIVLRAGGWHIIDESSNGTYANRDGTPIGRGNRRPILNNDRIRLGPYELEATLDEDTLAALRPASSRTMSASGRWLDPFADRVPPHEPPVRVARSARTARRDGKATAMHDMLTRPEDAIPATLDDEAPEQARMAVNADASPPDELRSAMPSGRAPSPATPPSDSALLAAFFEGLDMPDVYPTDAEATFRRLGETFRVLVTGMRSVLVARAAIKREFRIEQTMIRARGNNPLKFAADDDDAIAALLGTGRRSDTTPAAMVAEALRDIRLHELATITAMQSAARALLADLDPERIRQGLERAGGVTLLPATKKARAWETYEALHSRIGQALQDDFDSVFSRAFAKAYEDALGELDASEPE